MRRTDPHEQNIFNNRHAIVTGGAQGIGLCGRGRLAPESRQASMTSVPIRLPVQDSRLQSKPNDGNQKNRMNRRFCLTLDLRDDPALIAEYKSYHQRIWPEITQSIRDSGIEDMEIYLL